MINGQSRFLYLNGETVLYLNGIKNGEIHVKITVKFIYKTVTILLVYDRPESNSTLPPSQTVVLVSKDNV